MDDNRDRDSRDHDRDDKDYNRGYVNEQQEFQDKILGKMRDNLNSITEFPLHQQFIYSVKSPSTYTLLLKQRSKAPVHYFFFIVLLITLFANIVPLAGTVAGVGGVSTYIANYIPFFQLENGKLNVKEKVNLERNDAVIIVDTEKKAYTEKDLDHDHSAQVMAGSEEVLFYNNGITRSLRYSDLGDISYSKADMLSQVPLFYILMVIYVIVEYVGQGIGYLMTMVLLLVFGLILRSLYRRGSRLEASELFTLSVYALTWNGIINALCKVLIPAYAGAAGLVGMFVSTYFFFSAISIITSEKNIGIMD